MEVTFATVAEGSTDLAVMENILLGFCRSRKIEAVVNPTYPEIDDTGRQLPTSFGGWLQVHAWLKNRRYVAAFQYNKYVVIHIDSDVCDAGMGVDKRLPALQLVEAIRIKLEELIGAEDIQIYKDKFFFAVAVHSIECWLLPIWGGGMERGRITNCKNRVDRGLRRANRPALNKREVITYNDASKSLLKPAILSGAANEQESLFRFLEELKAGVKVG